MARETSARAYVQQTRNANFALARANGACAALLLSLILRWLPSALGGFPYHTKSEAPPKFTMGARARPIGSSLYIQVNEKIL